MKELPYFKFYPGEWMKGNITDCSLEAQGLFVNVCVLYWMRTGDLTVTRVERKFNNCSNLLAELSEDGIISIFDDEITIEFLDEQFNQFEILREHKSRAGKASAKKRKANTRSTPVQQNSTIKRREEKIIEEKKEIILPFVSERFLEYWGYWKEFKKREFNFKYKSAISEQAAAKELANMANGNEDTAIKIIEQSLAKGWKGFFHLKKEEEKGDYSNLKREIYERYGQ